MVKGEAHFNQTCNNDTRKLDSIIVYTDVDFSIPLRNVVAADARVFRFVERKMESGRRGIRRP